MTSVTDRIQDQLSIQVLFSSKVEPSGPADDSLRAVPDSWVQKEENVWTGGAEPPFLSLLSLTIDRCWVESDNVS
jgi:hypothetical protein